MEKIVYYLRFFLSFFNIKNIPNKEKNAVIKVKRSEAETEISELKSKNSEAFKNKNSLVPIPEHEIKLV